MEQADKIYVAGHRGMVGSAIMRKLEQKGFHNLVYRTSKELDLRHQQQVNDFFAAEKPEYVFLAAAKVGGIMANNTCRGEFLYDNLMIQSNVIHAAFLNQVEKLMFMGSSCIYPRLAPQPIKEEYILGGELESTNEPYAIAKIAGIKLCDAYRDQYGCNFISVMPTNLYGPNDNYDLQKSHVLPALIRKFITAREKQLPIVELWGSGTPRREFLHADDLADACFYLMNTYDEPGHINVGVGEDVSILDLAKLIQNVVGFEGRIVLDKSKPDGTPRKLLDVSKLKSRGWEAKISLEDGIRKVYEEINTRYRVEWQQQVLTEV